MEAAELHERLTRGLAVEDADLSDIDWQERSYDEPMFAGCRFGKVHFTNTRLAGGRFTRCHFLCCRFSYADLREALFQDCVFVDRTDKPEGCVFALSELRSARFVNSDLSFATFDRCDLFSIEMERCNLLGSSFTKVDFSHAYSRKVVSTRALLRSCNLELANLAELRLASCDLSGSRLREANLERTDLSDADLRDCDLFQAVLDGVRLDRADLRSAQISGLNLLCLASFSRLKINADQQYALLTALGIEVDP